MSLQLSCLFCKLVQSCCALLGYRTWNNAVCISY